VRTDGRTHVRTYVRSYNAVSMSWHSGAETKVEGAVRLGKPYHMVYSTADIIIVSHFLSIAK